MQEAFGELVELLATLEESITGDARTQITRVTPAIQRTSAALVQSRDDTQITEAIAVVRDFIDWLHTADSAAAHEAHGMLEYVLAELSEAEMQAKLRMAADDLVATRRAFAGEVYDIILSAHPSSVTPSDIADETRADKAQVSRALHRLLEADQILLKESGPTDDKRVRRYVAKTPQDGQPDKHVPTAEAVLRDALAGALDEELLSIVVAPLEHAVVVDRADLPEGWVVEESSSPAQDDEGPDQLTLVLGQDVVATD